MLETYDVDPSRLIAPEDDQRTFRRFSPDCLAFVVLPQTPAPPLSDSAGAHNRSLLTLQPVPVRDLSMTGLAFFSKLVYPVGADLEVCLCLDHVEYRVAGTVKRRQRAENLLLSYGVNFVQSQTTKPFRIALASFLLRHDAAVRPAGARSTATPFG